MIPRLQSLAREAVDRVNELELWETALDTLSAIKGQIDTIGKALDETKAELLARIDKESEYTKKVEEKVDETKEDLIIRNKVVTDYVAEVDERLVKIEEIEVRDGKDGEKGDRGEKGEKGEQGERGERGERGLKGEKGDKGERGERGRDGKDGKNGKDGEDGSPDTPKEIVEKLQDYTKKKAGWLDARAIKNLPALGRRGGGSAGGGSTTVNEGRYVKWYIASDETVDLVDYEQYNAYRLLEVDGVINLSEGSEVNIIAD